MSLTITGGPTIYLGNAYTDCRKSSVFRGRQVLRNYVGLMLQLDTDPPEIFEQARDSLLPRVRDRGFFGIFSLRARAEGRDFESPPNQNTNGPLGPASHES